MLIDIVVLPTADVRRRLGVLARRLNHKYPAHYIIDNKNLIPHISLYHFRTVTRRLKYVEQVVKKALVNTHSFQVTGKLLHKGRYSIELVLKNSSALKNLNKAVLLNCAPLRTGLMPSTFEQKMTKQAKQALKHYGTVGTVINYEPHVTLLADFRHNEIKKGSIGNYSVAFWAHEIAIAEVNNWYQVIRILKRFRV